MGKRVKLPSGKIIFFNEQQEEASELIINWLRGTSKCTHEGGNDLLFCLEGYAGTGKTTIIKDSLDHYRFRIKPGYNNVVAVTAPTHKAKKEISNATDIQGKTIQSLVGLAPNLDVAMFDINNPDFAVLNEPGIKKFKVIVVDEASMLNTDLFELLTKQAIDARTMIIFMCDRAQLPPVGEEISPVLTSPLIGHRYQLTKVERQADDNPLMLVYDAIRSDIGAMHDVFPHRTNLIELPKPEFIAKGVTEEEINAELDAWNAIKPVKIGPEFLTELSTFGSRCVTAFVSEAFKDDPNYCKLLCWTNKKVKYWNSQIRKTMVLQRRKTLPPEETVHDEVVMEGELLMGYQSYNDGLTNSAEYVVTDINYEEVSCEYGNFINGDPAEGREFEAKFNVYNVRLSNDLEDFVANIVEPTTENYQNFMPAFTWYLNQGKFNRRWPMYYGWKKNYMLLTSIYSADKKLIVKKDVDYAYALSTHKSQGSTYTNVFVDEADIDQLENEGFVQYLFQEERGKAVKSKEVRKFDKLYPTFSVYWQKMQVLKNKLKYVAFSRPVQKACIFTTKS